MTRCSISILMWFKCSVILTKSGDALLYSRCNSENCRALLERYDAPPAIDAVNEEAHGLQVNWTKVTL